MSAYELVEHTADVAVSATGETLAEALVSVAQGMFSVITDAAAVESSESLDVSIESPDLQALVVDWLNELLYYLDAEDFLPRDFEVVVSDDHSSLRAKMTGQGVDRRLYESRTDVKAATYHGLEVASDDGWRIHVVLDV